jgi:hypothetical protein
MRAPGAVYHGVTLAETVPVLHDTLLWLFVIVSGIAAGAGFYELRINVPRWFTSSGGTGLAVDVGAIRADDSGRRFWAFVTTGPLSLLTLAALAAAWNPATAQDRWWLAAAGILLVERVATFGYFIPTLLAIMRPRRQASGPAALAARRWMQLNYVRAALACAGWLAALRALSL